MTTELKILQLYHQYRVPIPQIAAILDVEIRRHTKPKIPNSKTITIAPLPYVIHVIATEANQCHQLAINKQNDLIIKQAI